MGTGGAPSVMRRRQIQGSGDRTHDQTGFRHYFDGRQEHRRDHMIG